MEPENKSQKNEGWRKFYKNWKDIWRNPEVTVYEKVILFDIYLYRSDGKGWSISERRIASDLGIAKGTSSKAIDRLFERSLIGGPRSERKRGKIRLTGSLRSPDWVSRKPSDWVNYQPSKYQSKYIKKTDFSFKEKEREQKMEKVMTPEELHKRIAQWREKQKI